MPFVAPHENHGGMTPTAREWHWVGDINLGAKNDGYVGATTKTFYSLRSFNRYFSDSKKKLEDGVELGMLLIQVLHIKPILWGLLGTHIIALVTNQLAPEEMEEMIEVSRRNELAMKEWRIERAKRMHEEQQVKKATDNEVLRLAQVGDHCERNHKHNMKKELP